MTETRAPPAPFASNFRISATALQIEVQASHVGCHPSMACWRRADSSSISAVTGKVAFGAILAKHWCAAKDLAEPRLAPYAHPTTGGQTFESAPRRRTAATTKWTLPMPGNVSDRSKNTGGPSNNVGSRLQMFAKSLTALCCARSLPPRTTCIGSGNLHGGAPGGSTSASKPDSFSSKMDLARSLDLRSSSMRWAIFCSMRRCCISIWRFRSISAFSSLAARAISCFCNARCVNAARGGIGMPKVSTAATYAALIASFRFGRGTMPPKGSICNAGTTTVQM
mmetsp:Transcript_28768/g.83238  ORF Transcript_28768/g.83238 Transcript_28768/m.83238 type:complete len:281 (-) Transcript_28768:936-1778(-)